MPACHAGDRRFESGRVRHRPRRHTPRRVRGVLIPRIAGRAAARATIRDVKRASILFVLALLAGAGVLACGDGLHGESPAANRGRLGFLRADAVGPAVRALSWRGSALFGVDRVASVAAWPLTARLPAAAHAFAPSRLWTVAAAGDIMLDRGVYRETILRGRGVDFPFGGGRAAITGHRCCTSFGWPIPLTRRLGNAGAVREIVAGADLAFANNEGPA